MTGFGLYKPITTEDLSSGRFHVRIPLGKRLLVDERCNLDAAGGYRVHERGGRGDRGDGVPVGTDPSLLCQYCFPPDDDTDEDDKSKDRV